MGGSMLGRLICSMFVVLVAAAVYCGQDEAASAHGPATNNHQHADRASNSPAVPIVVNVPAPTVVKVGPTAKEIQEIAEYEAAKRRVFGLDPDTWSLIGTLLLFAVNILLWLATRSNADAARHAAEIAERSLSELEGPLIFVKVTKTGIEINEKSNEFRWRRLKFRLANVGRSPATILAVHDEIHVLRKGAGLPPPIDPTTLTADTQEGYYVGPDSESEEIDRNLFGREFTEEGAETNNAIRYEVFLNVFVRYRDIFSKPTTYIAGFQFMLDKAFDKFVLTRGGETRNYRRKEG